MVAAIASGAVAANQARVLARPRSMAWNSARRACMRSVLLVKLV